MIRTRSILAVFAASRHNLPSQAPADDHGRENVLDLAQSMLAGSSLIYNYANLREAARGEIKKKGIDSLKESALIITQDGAQETGKDQYLKYSITADAILRFVDLNNKFVKGVKDLDNDETSLYYFPIVLALMKETGGEIKEFNDEFAKKDLVYALTINRSDKRITVCFRGSVTRSDWRINLNAVR
jgi:hypothetical protein